MREKRPARREFLRNMFRQQFEQLRHNKVIPGIA